VLVLGSLFPSQRSAGPWWLLLLSGLPEHDGGGGNRL